jgi:hypothetical protein
LSTPEALCGLFSSKLPNTVSVFVDNFVLWLFDMNIIMFGV